MGFSAWMLLSRRAVHSRGFPVLHRSFSSPVSPKIATNRESSKVTSFEDVIDKELEAIRQQEGQWIHAVLVKSRQDARISIGDDSRQVLNFVANNYSGLVNHPAVIEAGIEAYRTRGGGLSSSRPACGSQDLHWELEAKLAKFHNKESAILFNSCSDANIGLFAAILTNEDAVISDELNHASIVDGIRLCKAAKYRYKHRNMEDLENKLKATQGARIRLIASDGVFSMDATYARLREMRALADEYNATLFIDDCHATGILGERGRGLEDHFDMTGSADIINSTLGKGIGGGTGGYTVGSKKLTELLTQRHRMYLYSYSISPSAVAATSKALDLLLQSSEVIEKLHMNTKHFREGMTDVGFTLLGEPSHPICPLMLGDIRLTRAFTKELLDRGIYTLGVCYPVVPEGTARIRIQISSTHSSADIDKTIAIFTEVGRKLKVIT